MNDAGIEAALFEQFDMRANVVRQGAFAATDEYRAQEEMALVYQPGVDRLAGEISSPDRDVGRRGQLQPTDGVRLELALDLSLDPPFCSADPVI